ncbi:MAG: oxidoreductase [Pseudomonadota bacterium]
MTIKHHMSTRQELRMNSTKKIAIITGANNGIGFDTTLGVAKAGCHVIMACRSADKAEAAKAKVLELLPSASLEVMLLDLGDFASVRVFAESFRGKHERLDVLINNAGILLYSAKVNGDGIELQLATNHMGHFLLTALLIDLMPDDPASRVVSLSSLAHKGAKMHFDDFTCGGDGGVAYGQSKLASLLFGDELDRRLRASGKRIKSVTVHPGGSETGLAVEMAPEQLSAIKEQVGHLLQSSEDAAKPSLHAALSPDAMGGEYYGPIGPQELNGEVGRAMRDPITSDLAVAERLWTVSEDLTSQPFTI